MEDTEEENAVVTVTLVTQLKMKNDAQVIPIEQGVREAGRGWAGA